MALRTDYKDDIPKTENRRYQMINNSDGTVSFVDVTEYTQVGDTFGAGDINTTNEAVNGKMESTDIVNHNLATEPGFAADALAVKNQFDEQNKKLEWKIYSSIGSLGLGYDITMNDILDSLLQRGSHVMLIVPIFKSDYPNLMFGGTGLRHMFTIKCVSGYVTIEDFDISNMTIHINAHNGNGYIGWKTL